MGGAGASWLVCLPTDRVVWVRALAGDIVLCSWARHLTLTVPLFTQEYKWVPVICWGILTNCWGATCDRLASCPGGVEILLAASCYGNRAKLWPDEPVGSIRLHQDQVNICVLMQWSNQNLTLRKTWEIKKIGEYGKAPSCKPWTKTTGQDQTTELSPLKLEPIVQHSFNNRPPH